MVGNHSIKCDSIYWTCVIKSARVNPLSLMRAEVGSSPLCPNEKVPNARPHTGFNSNAGQPGMFLIQHLLFAFQLFACSVHG